jgi:hypothetical protein
MGTHLRFLLIGLLLALFAQPGYCDDDEEDKEKNDKTKEAWLPIWKGLGCRSVFAAGPRPIHSTSDWIQARQAYVDVLTSSSSSQKITIPNPVVASSGFAVPVEARQTESIGRGIFVTDTPVKKGQKVWSTVQTARFEKGDDFRRFLQSIPNSLSCDILEFFSYVQSVKNAADETEKLYISTDLDEGCFINSVEDWNGDGIERIANIGCDHEMAKNEPGGCQENYFALRDIAVGEELLLDYEEFAIYNGWDWFDPHDGSVAEQ